MSCLTETWVLSELQSETTLRRKSQMTYMPTMLVKLSERLACHVILHKSNLVRRWECNVPRFQDWRREVVSLSLH